MNDIKEWIKDVAMSIDDLRKSSKPKISILMNDHPSGFIASKLAVDLFGNDNVVNVILPCYSKQEYIIESAKFSNDNKIKYKNIGIKHIIDSIFEKDIEDDGIYNQDDIIIKYLRDKIVESLSIKNDSMIFKFDKFGDDYIFKIIYFIKDRDGEVISKYEIPYNKHFYTEEELEKLKALLITI